MFGAFTGGVSLAIAASCALLAVSSVVAFRGWPESDSAPHDPEVTQLQKVKAEAKATTAVKAVALPKAVAVALPARHVKHAKHHAGAKTNRTKQTSTTRSTAGKVTVQRHSTPVVKQD